MEKTIQEICNELKDLLKPEKVIKTNNRTVVKIGNKYVSLKRNSNVEYNKEVLAAFVVSKFVFGSYSDFLEFSNQLNQDVSTIIYKNPHGCYPNYFDFVSDIGQIERKKDFIRGSEPIVEKEYREIWTEKKLRLSLIEDKETKQVFVVDRSSFVFKEFIFNK